MRLESFIMLNKGIILLCLLLLAFLTGLNIGSGVWFSNEIGVTVNPEATNLCDTGDLIESMECLNNEFRSWYFYNESNVLKKLSEDQFKEQGGVCSHSSKWYINKAKSMGYYAETVDFFGDIEVGHEVALIYHPNLTSYCIVDQSTLWCKELMDIDWSEVLKNVTKE